MRDKRKVSRDDIPIPARRESKSQGEPAPALTPAQPEQGLGVRTLITRARGSVLLSLDAELDRFGVTGAQFEVLKNLFRNTVETGASLCRTLHYDTGSMTRMLDRLEEKGLVRRERGARDRRVVLLRLTDAGERLLPRIRPAARRALRRHLAGFAPEEIDCLKDYLGRIIANGRRQHAETRAGKAGRSKGGAGR